MLLSGVGHLAAGLAAVVGLLGAQQYVDANESVPRLHADTWAAFYWAAGLLAAWGLAMLSMAACGAPPLPFVVAYSVEAAVLAGAVAGAVAKNDRVTAFVCDPCNGDGTGGWNQCDTDGQCSMAVEVLVYGWFACASLVVVSVLALAVSAHQAAARVRDAPPGGIQAPLVERFEFASH